MDDEISKTHPDGRCGDSDPGIGARNLFGEWSTGFEEHISQDHVDLFVSVPPRLSSSRLMQYINGKTSRKVVMEFPYIRNQY